MAIETYIPGEWNVICDRCGKKKKISQVTLQMNAEQSNVLHCTDTCLDKHQQQIDVRGVPDYQSVALARPSNVGSASGTANFAGSDAIYGNTTQSFSESLTKSTSPLFNINGPNQPNG